MEYRIDPEFRNAQRKHTKQERENLEVKIQNEGCNDGALTVGSIGPQNELILVDGHHTHDICEKHGIPKCKPRVILFKDREEALDWIHTHQRSRRNLSVEEMVAKRQERIAQVAEMRQEGKSTRQIAEELEVSKSQVLEDLKDSGGHRCPPENENGKVTGKDGKKYPAHVKPPAILCPSCKRRERMGQDRLKGCHDCKELNAPKPKPTAKPIDKALPKSVQNALADTWHAECARILSRIAKECKSAFTWSSYLDGSVLDHLKAAEECFTTAMPRKVCPECKGQKQVDKKPCQHCRHGGYMASHA